MAVQLLEDYINPFVKVSSCPLKILHMYNTLHMIAATLLAQNQVS